MYDKCSDLMTGVNLGLVCAFAELSASFQFVKPILGVLLCLFAVIVVGDRRLWMKRMPMRLNVTRREGTALTKTACNLENRDVSRLIGRGKEMMSTYVSGLRHR